MVENSGVSTNMVNVSLKFSIQRILDQDNSCNNQEKRDKEKSTPSARDSAFSAYKTTLISENSSMGTAAPPPNVVVIPKGPKNAILMPSSGWVDTFVFEGQNNWLQESQKQMYSSQITSK